MNFGENLMFRLKHLDKILFLFVFSFGLCAQAQEKCLYGFKIYVRDETGKTIEKAKLEASGLTEQDKLPADVKPTVGYSGAYILASNEGTTIDGNFVLRVSAEGFETYERQFEFPECEFQIFELKLKPKGSSAKAEFERLFNFHGRVFDEEKKPFGNAKIEVTYASGKVYQTSSNAYGYYEFDLPKGVVNIRVTNSRIPDIRFDNYKVEEDNYVLNVPVCLKCKQKESKN